MYMYSGLPVEIWNLKTKRFTEYSLAHVMYSQLCDLYIQQNEMTTPTFSIVGHAEATSRHCPPYLSVTGAHWEGQAHCYYIDLHTHG